MFYILGNYNNINKDLIFINFFYKGKVFATTDILEAVRFKSFKSLTNYVKKYNLNVDLNGEDFWNINTEYSVFKLNIKDFSKKEIIYGRIKNIKSKIQAL